MMHGQKNIKYCPVEIMCVFPSTCLIAKIAERISKASGPWGATVQAFESFSLFYVQREMRYKKQGVHNLE
jgi:hypothetical protein